MRLTGWLLGAAIFLACGSANAQALKGVNLAGAGFSPDKLPGIYGQDFIFPNASEVNYFTAKGMNVFRVSILWERLQPALFAPLDPDQLSRLQAFVDQANARHASVIIDLHNYGEYRGILIGENPVSVAAFADCWAKLAKIYRNNNAVIFGLMNEPQVNSLPTWKNAVQQAILGIRRQGSKNRILVSGIAWDSAAGFAATSGGSLGTLTDPADALIFEVHQYFDTDSSGTHSDCIDANSAQARFTAFTQWLRDRRAKGFLGEFGVSPRPECLAVLDQLLGYLRANADVWTGWTYWAAGPYWGNYMFSIEPQNGKDRPQMQVLERYLQKPS